MPSTGADTGYIIDFTLFYRRFIVVDGFSLRPALAIGQCYAEDWDSAENIIEYSQTYTLPSIQARLQYRKVAIAGTIGISILT